jgi:acetoin utilization protein AcuB
MMVQDVMSTPVTTVTPDTLVQTAAQMLRAIQIRHLPVVTDAGTLVGILTDRDLRRAAASDVPHLAEYAQLAQLTQLRV